MSSVLRPTGSTHLSIYGRRVGRRRQRRRRRRTAVISSVILVASAVVLVVAVIPGATTRNKVVVGRAVTVTEAPVQAPSPDASRFLPATGSSISQLTTYSNPTDATYEQLYVGDQPTNPAELIVASIDLAQGRSHQNALSAGNFPDASTVAIGPVTAKLSVAGVGNVFVWWTRPDGVEVDVSTSGLGTDQVIAALRTASSSTTSRLGVVLGGDLPGGLHQASSALSEQTNIFLEDVEFTTGRCVASLRIYEGVGGLYSNGTGVTRSTTFLGHPALLTDVPGGSNLGWSPVPGITAELGAGGSCDALALARSIRRIPAAAWQAELKQLGTRASQQGPMPGEPSTTTAPISNNPEQPVFTGPGPERTTLHLTASGTPAGTCETLNIDDPGISLDPGGGKPAYVAHATCQPSLPAGNAPLSASLWISHSDTRYFLVEGRAPGSQDYRDRPPCRRRTHHRRPRMVGRPRPLPRQPQLHGNADRPDRAPRKPLLGRLTPRTENVLGRGRG